MHPVRAFFHEFEWIHIGMLIGSIGSAVVKLWRVDGRIGPST